MKMINYKGTNHDRMRTKYRNLKEELSFMIGNLKELKPDLEMGACSWTRRVRNGRYVYRERIIWKTIGNNGDTEDECEDEDEYYDDVPDVEGDVNMDTGIVSIESIEVESKHIERGVQTSHAERTATISIPDISEKVEEETWEDCQTFSEPEPETATVSTKQSKGGSEEKQPKTASLSQGPAASQESLRYRATSSQSFNSNQDPTTPSSRRKRSPSPKKSPDVVIYMDSKKIRRRMDTSVLASVSAVHARNKWRSTSRSIQEEEYKLDICRTPGYVSSKRLVASVRLKEITANISPKQGSQEKSS